MCQTLSQNSFNLLNDDDKNAVTYVYPFNKWGNWGWDRSSGGPVAFHSSSLCTGLFPPQDLLEQAHRLHPDPRPFMVDSHISVASFILNDPVSLWPSTCLNIKSEWTLSPTINGKHNGSGLRHSSLNDSFLRTSAISCQPGDRACLLRSGWGLAYEVGSWDSFSDVWQLLGMV